MKSHHLFPAVDALDPAEVIHISNLPPKVDFNDLQLNDRLLDDDQINLVKEKFAKHPDGLISLEKLQSKDPNINFEIIKINNDFYAVYNKKNQDKKLGSGGFGTVYIANHLNPPSNTEETWVALKFSRINVSSNEKKLNNEEEQREQFKIQAIQNEKQKLQIVGQLKGYAKEPATKETITHETLMTLAPGVDFDNLREPTTACLIDDMISLLKNLQAIHDKGIIHRDIKGANIQADAISQKINIIDFGISEAARPPYPPLSVTVPILSGTLAYLAPELIDALNNKKDIIFTDKTDVFAMGVTLAEKFGLVKFRKTKDGSDAFPYIVSTDSAEFINNKIIEDEKVRTLVLEFLRNMLEENPNKRKGTKECIQFFEEIRDLYLDIPAKIKRVAYIDIDDFIAAHHNALLNDDPSEKQNILKALRSTDELWLMDKDGNNKHKYMYIKQILQKEGISVGSQVVQYHQRSDIPKNIEKHALQQEKTRKCLINAAYVSNEKVDEASFRLHAIKAFKVEPKATTDNYKETMDDYLNLTRVTELHFNKVIKSLENEMTRLQNKYTNNKDKSNTVENRIEAIRLTCEALQNSKNHLTYGEMYSELRQLQNAMHSTSYNIFNWIAEKFGFSFVTGKKEIGQLVENIQLDTPKRKH